MNGFINAISKLRIRDFCFRKSGDGGAHVSYQGGKGGSLNVGGEGGGEIFKGELTSWRTPW